jgi:hypothetical protein
LQHLHINYVRNLLYIIRFDAASILPRSLTLGRNGLLHKLNGNVNQPSGLTALPPINTARQFVVSSLMAKALLKFKTGKKSGLFTRHFLLY